MNVRLPLFLLATLCAMLPARSSAESPDALAVLESNCVKCHGGEKTKGGLDLVTREALMRGGESGQAIVPGEPDSSLLLKTIRHEEDPHMPHKAAKLPDAEIAAIAAWIKMGAPLFAFAEQTRGRRSSNCGNVRDHRGRTQSLGVPADQTAHFRQTTGPKIRSIDSFWRN
jgi:cytochrome c553